MGYPTLRSTSQFVTRLKQSDWRAKVIGKGMALRGARRPEDRDEEATCQPRGRWGTGDLANALSCFLTVLVTRQPGGTINLCLYG